MTNAPERPDEGDAWIDAMLDDLARTPVPDTPDRLMARVLADAQEMLPAPGGAVVRAPWWRQIVEGIGGWTAVGGLVAAAATGFAVGLGGLDTMGVTTPWPVSYETYYDSSGEVDAFGWDMEEG